MRSRGWSGKGLIAGLAGVLGVALCATGLPGSSALATDRPDPNHDVVAAALGALRDNAARLGFDTDRRGRQGLGERYGVTVTDVMVDPDGSAHVRLDRSYAGLPVRGGDFVVHRSADGRWRGATATLWRSLNAVNPVPVLGAPVASRLAGVAANDRPLGVPHLSVDALHGAPALTWEVHSVGTQPDGTPSRLDTFVDAVTGRVRARVQEIRTLRMAGPPDPGGDGGPLSGAVEPAKPARTEARGQRAAGSGRSLYDGKVALETSLLSETYSLKDLTRGASYTADAEDTADDCLPVALPVCTGTAPANVFTSKVNDWGDGTIANRQTVAVDAQYGSNMTWDFYKNILKRAGVNNDGVGVYSRVHYGHKYANAFWSDDCFCMTYGDGDGKELGPLVTLDITGHEITHGVTARTAKLGNEGESGGLNEANSDILGTMIEFYANNKSSPGDYLIGARAYLNRYDKHGQLNAIRYMDEPSKDHSSPDCWNSQIKQLDVHLMAGVGNHFFYLLSEGSGAKTINGIAYDSSTCNGKKLTGIGRDAAAFIWYRALTRYFTSGSDYAAARVAVVNAATDIYGANSSVVQIVNAAWDAVNVHVDQGTRDFGNPLF